MTPLGFHESRAYPIEWVVSFADATQCGDGTIYRASGFLLTGIRENKTVGSHSKPPAPKLTALEARYQAHLEEEQRAGRIVSWQREGLRFVLEAGKRFTYSADYVVVRRCCAVCSSTGLVRSVNADGKLVRTATCAGCNGTGARDEAMELVEVKPRDKKTGDPLYVYEDSQVKTKAVAALIRARHWPMSLVVTWPNRVGGWERKTL